MRKMLFAIETTDVESYLDTLFERTEEQLLAGGAVMADRLEAEAKRNAPWTDRTGMARRTLAGINTMDPDTGEFCVGLCGNMHYSPELEQRFNGKYGIVLPTMRKHLDTLLEDITAIISRQEEMY